MSKASTTLLSATLLAVPALLPLNQTSAQTDLINWFKSFDSVSVSRQTLHSTDLSFGISQGAQSSPGLPVAGIDHSYDDGYVNVDSSGNFGNLTANWGYDNASQVSGTDLLFHSLQPTDSFYGETELDEIPGLEIQMAKVLKVDGGKKIGLQIGFGYLTESFRQNDGFDLDYYEDAYDASLPVLPSPGYRGSFNDFTSLISDEPNRTITTLIGTGFRDVDLSLWTLRLGTYLEKSLNEKFYGSVQGGIVTAISDAKFSYSETFGGINYSDSVREQDLQWGLYAGASAGIRINETTSLFASYNYQRMEDLEIPAAHRTASLDFSNGYTLNVGLSYSF